MLSRKKSVFMLGIYYLTNVTFTEESPSLVIGQGYPEHYVVFRGLRATKP